MAKYSAGFSSSPPEWMFPYTGKEKLSFFVCSLFNHTVHPKTGLTNKINDEVNSKIYETVIIGKANINMVKNILETEFWKQRYETLSFW